jgi:Ser/Thr protein kinase RdoA (MazF antagonist)
VIPVEVDEVTPAWLSDALGADVRTASVLDAHSGTTGRARLAIDGDGTLPPSLFVKLAPFDERQRRFVDAVGLGPAEARFYAELGATVPVRVPATLHAATDGDRYVMVLEDLVASGCRFPRLQDDDVADLVGRIVDELAALHAQYWDAPELHDGLAWTAEGRRLAFGGGGPYIQRALERFGDDLPPAFRRIGELYVAHTPAIAELYLTGAQTLAHGDPHFGNLFVDGDRPGFFDWGMVMRRAGMWDVAYVLCNGLPAEVRRAHEHEWIARYRSGLEARGVDLDAGEAWEQYRLFAVYAWSSATSTAGVGDRWQPEAYARRATEEATTAVDDLDSIGLLESLL